MLRCLSEIINYRLQAQDGLIGDVKDFLFDDQTWCVRYLVADTGTWIPGRNVLISPAGFSGTPQWENRTFPVIYTKDMVKECPDIDTEKPISRQKEVDLAKHYHWSAYWETDVYAQDIREHNTMTVPEEGDAHLRSANEVRNYYIHAKDGDIGHAEDLIIDDHRWDIRYLVVKLRNWLPSKKVLIAPLWIESLHWNESKIYLNLSKDEVQNSPSYDPNYPINRQQEEVLYDYYGRPKYWHHD